MYETQVCTGCQKRRSIEKFSFRDRAAGVRQRRCKSCIKEMQREHYDRNPKQYQKRNERAYRKKKKWLDERKDRPCADCGGRFDSCAMDFHHRAGEEKIGALANMVRSCCSWQRLKEEIAKCDVICANCHRIRHRSSAAAGS